MTASKVDVLPTIFDNEVRPFLDAIDNLRNYGLDDCLNLPTVIVIGDQSSGKSSILEAVSGIQLPRGSGMVTRCPLQLQMKNNKNSTKWSAVLSFRDSSNELSKKDIKSPEDIEKLIIEAQNEILNDEDGISESLLTLSVEDAHVPDLTLIDLPGIARVSVGDQADTLPEQIISLLRKYACREESIILTVCPCTTDLATTEALKLAKEYDPETTRTYGVLTKADLIDKGNEESVLKILRNEVVPLKKGYTLVKCRGQKALKNKESLQKTLEKEKEFFTTHATFRSLEKNQWGINSLSQKLATDLINFIKKEVPNIRSSISKKLILATQEEQRLICNYPTTSDAKLNFVLNQTYEYVNLFNNLVEGRYWLEELEIIENKSTKLCLRLIPHARESFTDFHEKLVGITPVNSVDVTVNRLLKSGQGREPHEFLSYDTFKKIARGFIQNVEPLVTEAMDKIYYNLRSVLVALTDHYFGKYPAFKTNFMTIALGHLEECKDLCKHDLEMLLVKEKVFFTMDRSYEEKIASLESLKSTKYALKDDWLKYFLNEEEKRNQVYDNPASGNNSQTMKETLPKYIIVYYLVAIQRISENVSQTIIYFLMDKLYMNLKSKLPSHVACSDTYDLLDSDCVGVDDKKSSLKFKIKGLKQGIQEIDKLSKIKH